MSSPRASLLKDLLDRVLERYVESSPAELAAKLGVDKSYVAKLRGGWRPGRVRDDLWERLRLLDPAVTTARVAEATAGYGVPPSAHLLALAATAREIMRLVVDLQAQIGEALRSAAPAPAAVPTPLSPTELADQALAAVDAVKAAERGAPGRRRAQG